MVGPCPHTDAGMRANKEVAEGYESWWAVASTKRPGCENTLSHGKAWGKCQPDLGMNL